MLPAHQGCRARTADGASACAACRTALLACRIHYFACAFWQDKQEALPFLTEPHDALRLGVRSLKEDASVSHPVEAIQANVRSVLCR